MLPKIRHFSVNKFLLLKLCILPGCSDCDSHRWEESSYLAAKSSWISPDMQKWLDFGRGEIWYLVQPRLSRRVPAQYLYASAINDEHQWAVTQFLSAEIYSVTTQFPVTYLVPENLGNCTQIEVCIGMVFLKKQLHRVRYMSMASALTACPNLAAWGHCIHCIVNQSSTTWPICQIFVTAVDLPRSAPVTHKMNSICCP